MNSEARPLFRPEAVAYHERGLGPGNLLRHSAWVGWGYRAALVAVVLGLVFAAEVRVSPSISGPITASGSTKQLTMTIQAVTGPPAGSSVTAGSDRGRVTRVKPGPLAGTFNLEVELARRVPGRLPRSAVVHLGPERLAVFLFPSLRSVLGR